MKGYQGVETLVLGAAGFIGQWVARALEARGATVRRVTRRDLDLRDRAGVEALLRGHTSPVIFNLAGYGVDPSERDEAAAYALNAELLETVCLCLEPGQTLVHTGSALEYGDVPGDLSEEGPTHPTTLYGQSKLAGTEILSRICKMRGIRGLTARLFTVYGPGEHAGRLLPSLIEAARTGRPLGLTSGLQRRDFTYVEDVAEGLLRLGLAEAEPGAVVNLATGRLTSVRGFAETAAGILGIPPQNLKFGEVSTRPEEMRHAEVTVERLRRLTGWAPGTGIAEGIRNTSTLA